MSDETIRGILYERKRHSRIIENVITRGIVLLGAIVDIALFVQIFQMV